MDGIQPTAKKLHPLVATAAFAVIVVSVLGAIVLITDQVAAHKGPDTPVVAANDTGATVAAAQPAAPETSAAPETPTAPMPAPAHRAAPKPRPPAPAADGYGAPPPAAAVPPPPVAMAAPPPVCSNCGIVAAVRPVKTEGQGSGVGAVAGGVVGGLVGNQFGSGHGKTAMTVLGALGGVLGGNEVEKQVKATTRWYVDVRLDNGQLQTVPVPGNPGAIVGTRVRIQNGQLVREAPPQS